MAARISTARALAIEAGQAAYTDVTAATQNPAALLNATAAGALATLYLAEVVDDIRRRLVRATAQEPMPDALELRAAARDAMISLGATHPTTKRLAAALGVQ